MHEDKQQEEDYAADNKDNREDEDHNGDENEGEVEEKNKNVNKRKEELHASGNEHGEATQLANDEENLVAAKREFERRNIFEVVGNRGNSGPDAFREGLDWNCQRGGRRFLHETRKICEKVRRRRRGQQPWSSEDWQAAADLYRVRVVVQALHAAGGHRILSFVPKGSVRTDIDNTVYIVSESGLFFVALDPIEGKPFPRRCVWREDIEAKTRGRGSGSRRAEPRPPSADGGERVRGQQGRPELKDLRTFWMKNQTTIRRIIDYLSMEKAVDEHGGDPSPGSLIEVASLLIYLLPELNLPPNVESRIIFLGQQSSGKTSLLSRVCGIPIGFSQNDTATRRPVNYVVVQGNEESVTIDGKRTPMVEIGPTLKRIMESTASLPKGISDVPVEVKIVTRKQGVSINVLDMVGLTVSKSSFDPEDVARMTLSYWDKYIAPADSNGIAVIVTRTNVEKENSALFNTLDSIPSSCKDRVILVFTKGDLDLPDMIDTHKFRHCRSWPEVAEALFGRFWKHLKCHGVRTFITALDGSFNTTAVEDMISGGFTEKKIQGRYQESYTKAENVLKKHLGSIPAAIGEAFDDNPEERRHFFDTYVGATAFVNHARQLQLNSLLKVLPQITAAMTQRLDASSEELKQLEIYKKEMASMTMEEMINDFFKVFSLLLECALSGQSLADSARAKYRSQLVASGEDGPVPAVPVNPRPSPVCWPKDEEWRPHRNASALTMEQELQFCRERVPQRYRDSDSGLTFPFTYRPPLDDAQGESAEDDALEEAFVQRYNPTREPEASGAGLMKFLIRELVARLLWVDPGAIDRSQLKTKYNMAASVSGTYAQSINDHLAEVTKQMFEVRLAEYAARRFASILWHCCHFTLEYIKGMKQFSSLFTSKSSEGDRADDVATSPFERHVQELLEEKYFTNLYEDIKREVDKIAGTVNNLIDPFPAMFYEVCALWMPYNDDVVSKWTAQNPENKAYTSIVNQVRSGDSDDGITRIVEDIQQAPSRIEGAITGIFGQKIQLSTLAMNKMPFKAVPLAQEPARRFLRSMLNYDRFVEKEDLSDVAFYLMNLNNCPEAVPVLERDDQISTEELERINYVFLRNFRARVFDFQRMCYSELMKKVVVLLDPTTLMWNWSHLVECFYALLAEQAADDHAARGKEKEAGTPSSAQQRSPASRAMLLKQAYQEIDARAQIDEQIGEWTDIRNNLTSLQTLLQWYNRQVQRNRAAISQAMFQIS